MSDKITNRLVTSSGSVDADPAPGSSAVWSFGAPSGVLVFRWRRLWWWLLCPFCAAFGGGWPFDPLEPPPSAAVGPLALCSVYFFTYIYVKNFWKTRKLLHMSRSESLDFCNIFWSFWIKSLKINRKLKKNDKRVSKRSKIFACGALRPSKHTKSINFYCDPRKFLHMSKTNKKTLLRL